MHSPAMMAAVPEDPDSPIASEKALLQSPPLPHERVFYWGSGSPQAWRVLIALEEKGIPYRSVCVSFSSGVLKTPFFQALNPRMRIPVLVEPVDDDADAVESASATSSPFFGLTPSRQERVVLYESAAILEYLERRFPQPPCMPHNLHAFAMAQTRLHEANEILSVVGDLVVYLRRFPVDKRNPAVLQAKWGALDAELAIWEAYFDGRPFLVSRETPYLCDFTLFTNIAYAVRCGLQLDGLYPRLAMFYVRLCARPSIEKTWPPHWKTTFGTKVLTKCFYCSGQGQCSCCPPSGNGDTNAASPK
ncbi:hypothetical protein Poli38472_012713 [Pythium oligandrum]|uniref:Glutathione S-transferase n=1 Tax=Pythium oligandrum TaxID=41045 RepID=A0A8K1CDY7_PYTOL|nr:hypothetical protein Poli38472_012713 [Pythium oligandrum]|eukprot:TMW61522.1 hypothetical protein Poli38472_012713 [Pythium oligandrum]